jgi:hypothetical protein
MMVKSWGWLKVRTLKSKVNPNDMYLQLALRDIQQGIEAVLQLGRPDPSAT